MYAALIHNRWMVVRSRHAGRESTEDQPQAQRFDLRWCSASNWHVTYCPYGSGQGKEKSQPGVTSFTRQGPWSKGAGSPWAPIAEWDGSYLVAVCCKPLSYQRPTKGI